MKLTRITIYTPSAVISHVTDGYAALFGTHAAFGNDERGDYIEVISDDGLVIELRPVEIGGGDVPTVTRLEFRGGEAQEAAQRLRNETHDVQRHLYGGWWDTLAGNTIRLIPDANSNHAGDWPEPPKSERTRISEAIRRGELEAEIERMNSMQPSDEPAERDQHHT